MGAHTGELLGCTEQLDASKTSGVFESLRWVGCTTRTDLVPRTDISIFRLKD